MSQTSGERHEGRSRLARLATDWRVQAVLAVVALGLAVAVGMALARRASPPAEGWWPINASWRAAAEGDDAAYIACFTGQARQEAEARLARLGRAAFQKELRAAAEGILGFQWGPPQPAPDGALRFPVSLFRKDETELLDYVVVKEGTSWRIRSVEPRGRTAASPPYGERLGQQSSQGDQR
ncbi:MAG: hypothetical protein FJ291_24325 [Planctomycetes bacterium]|nr:hypothetical protein [Planctomycetota bacterium]